MSDRPATAVVTGAAMGMGKAISQRLIAEGVTVVGLDLNPDALQAARAELGDKFEPVTGDVGDWDAHQRGPVSGGAWPAASLGQQRRYRYCRRRPRRSPPSTSPAACGCCSTG